MLLCSVFLRSFALSHSHSYNFPYRFGDAFIFTCDWNSQTSALLVLDVFGIRCACSVKNISFRFIFYTSVIFRNPAFAAKINSSLDVIHQHHFCAIYHVTLLYSISCFRRLGLIFKRKSRWMFEKEDFLYNESGFLFLTLFSMEVQKYPNGIRRHYLQFQLVS